MLLRANFFFNLPRSQLLKIGQKSNIKFLVKFKATAIDISVCYVRCVGQVAELLKAQNDVRGSFEAWHDRMHGV
jgi:hypothetical protein